MEKSSLEKNADYVSPEMQRRAERIEVLMKREGYKHRKDFAAIIDMEPQNFSRCMRSGKISEKICKRIITAFPDYRIEWLLGYDNIPTHYEWSDVYEEKRDKTDYCCWGLFENSLQKKGLSLRFNHKGDMALVQRHYPEYRDKYDCYYSIVDNGGNEVKRLTVEKVLELEQKLLEYSDFLADRYL